MSNSQYNGWRNRETWLVNVWFNPETQADLDFARETLEKAVDECPDFLKDFIYESDIDWDELAQHVEAE